MRDVSKIAKMARKNKRLTQQKLAKILGVTAATIQAWEKDYTAMKVSNFVKWIKVLGIVPEVFPGYTVDSDGNLIKAIADILPKSKFSYKDRGEVRKMIVDDLECKETPRTQRSLLKENKTLFESNRALKQLLMKAVGFMTFTQREKFLLLLDDDMVSEAGLLKYHLYGKGCKP